MRSLGDDGIVVHETAMGMYVIDARGQLWRADRRKPNDWDSLPVERPSADGSDWITARLRYDEITADPTDAELSELGENELAKFGMTKSRLIG